MDNITTGSTPRISATDVRREYKARWRRANPDKVREAQRRYWQRKADAMNAVIEAEAAHQASAGSVDKREANE